MLHILLCVFLVAFILYTLYLLNDDYFSSKRIPYEKSFPILGNRWRLFWDKINQFEFYDRYYKIGKSSNIGFCGIYEMFKKAIIVCDADILKSITVKDFDYFTDHFQFGSDDDFFTKSLFSLKGDRWRELRAILSPSFTSNKMRIMFELIERCSQNIDHYLQNKEKKLCKEGKKPIIKEEMKNLFSRFTNDAIATTAFGIEVDSLANPENEFYLMGKDFTNVSGGFRPIKLIIGQISPNFLKLFYKEGIFSEKAIVFFKTLFKDNIEKRRKENIHRPDMIHLMIEASSNGKKLSDEDMMAQALLFFFAGFDTISNSLSILMHHLATYPDIQMKLCQEIDIVLKKHNKITYDILMKELPYMEMVLCESQRLQPAGVFLDRLCVKRYTFPANEKRPYEITINPGQQLLIPPYSYHRDPEFFPEPERFIPERFSEEEKHSFHPYAFMPFGLGPRVCIANRFAKMEMKSAVFSILKNFKVLFIEETQNPIHFNNKGFGVENSHGYWLGFEKRKAVYT